MNVRAIQTFVFDVVCSLVLEPQKVEVNVGEEGGNLLVDIHAAQPDLGRIIGKGGRTVDALRTLLSLQATPTSSGAAKSRCVIRVQDPNYASPYPHADVVGTEQNEVSVPLAAKAPVMIYTKSRCPYCDAVKALLKSMNIKYQEISLEQDPDLFARLSEQNGGWRTVPMVFIEDRFVGGFDDTKALAQEGGLDHLRS